jgi:hypothetical protein
LAQFLSDDWFAEVEKARAEIGDLELPAAVMELHVNLEVRDAPSGTIEVHITGGDLGRGLVEGASAKLKVGYDVVRRLFIERDLQAVMQAFVSGQIEVEGDMAALLGMQMGSGPSAGRLELEERIRAFTD